MNSGVESARQAEADGETVIQPGTVSGVAQSHVAGAATPEWHRQMAKVALMQLCMGCGETIGLGDVELTSEHSRD
jgi:hypothetical protein